MVQITVDTEKDSKEHIQKVITFLQAIAGETPQPVMTPTPDFNVPTSGDMFSVFGDFTPSTPVTSAHNVQADVSLNDLLSSTFVDEEDEYVSSTSDDEPEDDDRNFFSLTQY